MDIITKLLTNGVKPAISCQFYAFSSHKVTKVADKEIIGNNIKKQKLDLIVNNIINLDKIEKSWHVLCINTCEHIVQPVKFWLITILL